MKFALPIAAAVGALIAVMVWKMASEPDVAEPAVDEKVEKTKPFPPSRTRPKLRGPQKLTPEEAKARPGVQRDKTVARIRQEFAAKSYDSVIVDSKLLLESGADDVTARLYLAMAACGKGDETSARLHLQQLPAERQAFAARKCKMLGINLGE